MSLAIGIKKSAREKTEEYKTFDGYKTRHIGDTPDMDLFKNKKEPSSTVKSSTVDNICELSAMNGESRSVPVKYKNLYTDQPSATSLRNNTPNEITKLLLVLELNEFYIAGFGDKKKYLSFTCTMPSSPHHSQKLLGHGYLLRNTAIGQKVLAIFKDDWPHIVVCSIVYDGRSEGNDDVFYIASVEFINTTPIME